MCCMVYVNQKRRKIKNCTYLEDMLADYSTESLQILKNDAQTIIIGTKT